MQKQTEAFKIIIAGGRDFDDYAFLRDRCDRLLARYLELPYLDRKEAVQVVSGQATGADTLGETYAAYSGFDIATFPADWYNLDVTPCRIKVNRLKRKYNALAGMIRNKQMGDYADALISFPGGSGTEDMITYMKSLGKPVRRQR